MSITSEIERIKTNISNAYDKAEEKGAEMPKQYTIHDNKYYEIEYIEGQGSQYISTNVYLTEATDFELTMSTVDNKYNGWQRLYGLPSAAGNSKFQIEGGNATTYNLGSNGQGCGSFTISTSDKFVLKKSNLTYTLTQNNTTQTLTASSDYINSDYNVLLLAGYDKIAAGSNAYVRIHRAKFYQNNTLISDLIPCIDRETEEIGLYDIVKKEFLTNAGSGDFIAGDYITFDKPKNSENLTETIDSIMVPEGTLEVIYNGTFNVKKYANVNVDIDTGEEEWQPQPDWWDIDTILENDTEEYPAKVIALFYDWNNSNTIYDERASKIKTSDGVEYTNFNVQHIWDKSKDKECSLGYKTRYLIYYYNDKNKPIMSAFPKGTFYVIFEGFDSYIENPGYGITRFGNSSIETVKYKKSKFKNHLNVKNILYEDISEQEFRNNINSLSYYSVCGSRYNDVFLTNTREFDCIGIQDLIYSFREQKINYLNIKNTQNVIYWADAFSYASIYYINSLDFNRCNGSGGSIFYGNSTIISINEVKNIKISGFNFSYCINLNHDTLIRILNALEDYSESETTYIITLGSTNLAKLTEDELAIGQDKGWTIN